MVWKQDLAKLKKALKDTEGPQAPTPAAKVVEKPEKSLDIQDEDALFLMAMGKRPKAVKNARELLEDHSSVATVSATHSGMAEGQDFQAAMEALKGVKAAWMPGIAQAPNTPKEARGPLPEEVEPERAVYVVTDITFNVPGPSPSPAPSTPKESARTLPTLIHLAAGMAVDVDGTLDLRGHSLLDAMERFRERVQDGVFLGWRTFHITLGPNDELREAFLQYLQTNEASALAKYAQAPIPMGGSQAWILYYPSH